MTIQQTTNVESTAMLGLGVYRPERIVTNAEVCEVLDSSDEWIQTRSGIKTRRFAGPDEDLITMATADADMRLLRVLWYDAAKGGVPDKHQRKVGMIDSGKLRMRRINPVRRAEGRRPPARP